MVKRKKTRIHEVDIIEWCINRSALERKIKAPAGMLRYGFTKDEVMALQSLAYELGDFLEEYLTEME